MSVGTTNVLRTLIAAARERNNGIVTVEFYLYPTVGTVLIHSVKPELTE